MPLTNNNNTKWGKQEKKEWQKPPEETSEGTSAEAAFSFLGVAFSEEERELKYTPPGAKEPAKVESTTNTNSNGPTHVLPVVGSRRFKLSRSTTEVTVGTKTYTPLLFAEDKDFWTFDHIDGVLDHFNGGFLKKTEARQHLDKQPKWLAKDTILEGVMLVSFEYQGQRDFVLTAAPNILSEGQGFFQHKMESVGGSQSHFEMIASAQLIVFLDRLIIKLAAAQLAEDVVETAVLPVKDKPHGNNTAHHHKGHPGNGKAEKKPAQGGTGTLKVVAHLYVMPRYKGIPTALCSPCKAVWAATETHYRKCAWVKFEWAGM